MENDSKNESTTPQGASAPYPRYGYKPLPGFEEQLEMLVSLYREHPEAIDMGKVTPDVLEDELEAYRAILATEEAARINFASLKHLRCVRGSLLWSRMIGVYGRAQAAGQASEEMKRAIAGVEEFLRPKPRRLEEAPAHEVASK